MDGRQNNFHLLPSAPLQSSLSNDNVTLERVAELHNYMNKITKLKEFCDINKIKYRENINQYYIVIHRRQYTSHSKKGLIDKLYREFVECNDLTLERAYIDWMQYRQSIGTNGKTLREATCEWNNYISGSTLAQMPLTQITITDIKDFFMHLTRNYAITYKRMVNVKSVISGIYMRSVEKGILSHNILTDIDWSKFRKRCKAENRTKTNYTPKERELLLQYLEQLGDIHSLAICFLFYLCIRCGELVAIKYSDIDFDGKFLKINRSTRKVQHMLDDMTFVSDGYCTEERMKGNTIYGFRSLPLTDNALTIVKKARILNPTGEYLFMYQGRQLVNCTINAHLKRACEHLSIPYRSTHQIRFTMATTLSKGGISIPELSTMLGHSNTATTMHYIRQQNVSDETANRVRNILSH